MRENSDNIFLEDIYNENIEMKLFYGLLNEITTTSVEKTSENVLTEEALEKTIREMTYGK